MIHFVGAGPGAADLITLRGVRLLQEADVVIYAGSLINTELLSNCKPGCELHDSARMTLEDVLAVMRAAEREGKTCVRLHSGDPSLYGAHREQMDALDELGIPYDVVPGVSSLMGAAAALRAEYTLPEVSQSLIVTRMEGRTPVPAGEKLRLMASHGCTMVLFLSASLLEGAQKELVAGGYSPDTPAAIVYRATWPDEAVYRCTVGTLAQCAREHAITHTALVTVGSFLGDTYERSRLYDPSFSHGFREASQQVEGCDQP
jgi:precorrin-4/cobalt-precorrin-4 C11-methyltransferase